MANYTKDLFECVVWLDDKYRSISLSFVASNRSVEDKNCSYI